MSISARAVEAVEEEDGVSVREALTVHGLSHSTSNQPICNGKQFNENLPVSTKGADASRKFQLAASIPLQ